MLRPKVIVLQETSIDGKLAVSADKPLLFGDPRWEAMRVPESVSALHCLMRQHSIQATLEGSNSFVREDDVPEPLPMAKGNAECLTEDYLPQSILDRENHRGWFIAADGRGRIRWRYKDGYPGDDTWIGWHALVLVHRTTSKEYLSYLQSEKIPYLIAGKERIDFRVAMKKIHEKLEVTSLLSTAGGRLNGHLLKSDLVDEINIELLPGIIGGMDAPSLFSGHQLVEDEIPTRLTLLAANVQPNGRIWLRYEVRSREEK